MTKQVNMPWEERPEGCSDVMWRYSQNPVIGRYDIPSSNSIFNSAVVPFEDGFAGVFRCDNKAVQMNIFAGFSKDGINWEINHEPIEMVAGNTEMIESITSMIHAFAGSKTDTGLPGVMDITDQLLVLHILSILRLFTSARMHFFLSIEMVCCFPKKLMVNMPC